LVLFTDESRGKELMRFCMLRQQRQRKGSKGHASLADFVAPLDSKIPDHVGAFAVTAGIGENELSEKYKAGNDDYNAIMVKSLADRMAEAFAELLHQRARKEWGYGADEKLDNDALIAEKFRGIRPAFGYPACPDHTEKRKLFELLDAPSIGIELTESFAMTPPA